MELLIPKLLPKRRKNMNAMPFLRITKNSNRIAFSKGAIELLKLVEGAKWMIGKHPENKNWYLFESMEGLPIKKHEIGLHKDDQLILSNAQIASVLREAFGTPPNLMLRLYISNPVKDTDGVFFKLTIKNPYL